MSILARVEAMKIEAVYRSQPVPGVVHELGKLKGLRQRRVHFGTAARARMQEGMAKCKIKAHVAAWIRRHLGSKVCDGLLDSCAAFAQQRQMRPQGHGYRRQRYANADIAARREGPVKGRAHVADLGPVRGEPLGGWPRLEFGIGMLQEVSIVLGVTS